ncbi:MULTISPECIES: hypothetical protein [unclassified Curtobacterium]|uniref:hypothetical protein n=1 Tax=unclassified Curtobacterium TaxID=257496 RepID=UPI0008DC67EC|nr:MULTISPECIES: hypothetical protein [unclassified Curtobacterium]OIH98359.1 hypothetical protein BIU92_14025 [Curtobacterium sp. MCBA15_003]OII32558.1 hypothetical protein BIU94_04450 [Curtobacterium sp. MMLR14_006]
MSLKTTLGFENLTWTDLYSFVELARRSGVSPDAEVEVELSENDDVVGLVAEIAPGDSPLPLVVGSETVEELRAVIDHLIDEDGDGRALLAQLSTLRDRLR